ncbi:MAG: hypothetical protein AAB966_02920 [Patescibacteria group bacterium]
MKLAANDLKGLFGEITPPPGSPDVSDPGAALGLGLTVALRLFFIVAGLAALLYMLLGSFDWVTSSGEKEKITKAQQRIRNAVVGVLIMVTVLALIATLETIVFNGKFCFGLTCAIKIPRL